MNIRTSSSLVLSSFGLALALLSGCTEQAAPAQPTTLGDVQVPSNFTFATTKAVALSVTASADKIGGEQGALAVERNDGKVLYRGPIAASKPLAVKLMIPSKDDELRLRLFAKTGELTQQVAVTSGDASYRFE